MFGIIGLKLSAVQLLVIS